MIIYQFIYIWPTSFTEYATVEVTWKVGPSGFRLEISGSNIQGMNPLKLGEAREFKKIIIIIFWGGAKLFRSFRWELSLRGLYLIGRNLVLFSIYVISNWTFYFHFHFRKMFRLLDYVILLYAILLGITLKSLVFFLYKIHFIIDRDLSVQFFISCRWLKKLSLLFVFSNSIFIKFCFKLYWHLTYIQKKLASKVSSILSYF